MKRTIAVIVIALALCGCARFSSVQVDTSYEKGLISRSISTKTKARTVFSSKSDLSRYRATTTDKTQSLGIGSLSQESPTNNLDVIDRVVGAAVKAAAGK